MKLVIVLSGPVGAGKSTVARELMASAQGPIAYIEGDIFWSFIAKGTGTRRHKNVRTIMLAMTAAAVPYALADFDVLLDFSIPPWFLPTMRKVVAARDVPLHYVVLRPSEAVCAARAAARTEGAIGDYAPYHDLYTAFDEAEQYTLHDDDGSAPTLATRIWDGISAGQFRLA